MGAHQQMNKENVVCIHYGVLFHLKVNEIMSLEGKWKELETIMLSKISQTEKDKCAKFSLICKI
jgi:hypothetical protein